MTTPTADFIALCNRIGADPEFTRAGGGNSSAKTGTTLRIKPSGVPLATLREEDLVPLDIPTLLDALHSPAPEGEDPVRAAAARAQLGHRDRRPSVEILFHALIPDPLVLHLHPLTANAVTCNARGAALTEEIFGDQAIWVDYTDPGIPLALEIERQREAFQARHRKRPPRITMLGNHGVIVSGATVKEIDERVHFLTASIRAAIERAAADMEEQCLRVASHFKGATGAAAVAIAADEATRSDSERDAGPVSHGPLIPDQIVYAGSLPLLLDRNDTEEVVGAKTALYRAQHGRLPVVAVIPAAAVIARGDSQGGADNALAVFLDALRVAREAGLLGEVRVMDEEERRFIEHWEAESYRKQVASAGLP